MYKAIVSLQKTWIKPLDSGGLLLLLWIFWSVKNLVDRNLWMSASFCLKKKYMHVFVPKICTLYKQFLCHRKRCGGMLTKVWSVSSSEWTNCCRGIVCTAAAVRTCSRLTSKVAPVRKVMGKQKPSGSTPSAWTSLHLSLNRNNSHLHHHRHYHHLHHPIWTLHALLMQKCMPVGAFYCFIHTFSLSLSLSLSLLYFEKQHRV